MSGISLAACPVKEGMSSPTVIADDSITSEPESESIGNVRPGRLGTWTESANNQPKIIVQLVDESDEPVPIGVVKVTGNLVSFTVLYTNADEDLTPLTKPDSQEPQVFISHTYLIA